MPKSSGRAKRPSRAKRLTKAKRQEYLSHLRDGLPRGAAAEAASLDRSQVHLQIHDDADLREAVELAESEAVENIEERLYREAMGGDAAAANSWAAFRADHDLARLNQTARDGAAGITP